MVYGIFIQCGKNLYGYKHPPSNKNDKSSKAFFGWVQVISAEKKGDGGNEGGGRPPLG